LRGLFAIALLVPVGTLFQALWRLDSDRTSVANHERNGIRYLSALGPLTTALVGAESAAVAGVAVPVDAVTDALHRVDAVDAQVGANLGTTERWNDLRGKIQTLVGRSAGDRIAAYEAYVDVTDLLLAHYAKVRDSSSLVQDPSEDAFFLQDAIGDQLPAAVIALGRLADLAALAPIRPADEAVETAAGLIAGKEGVVGATDALTEDFLLAVAITDSRTLSKTMLADIDAFRLVTDKVDASEALVDGHVTAADAADAAASRAAGVTAGIALMDAVASELDRIVTTRLDAIATDRAVTLAAGGLGVLLALSPVALGILGWRRSRRGSANRPIDAPPDAAPGAARVSAWSADLPHRVPVGGREASGAAR
jgi:hypothetical protein